MRTAFITMCVVVAVLSCIATTVIWFQRGDRSGLDIGGAMVILILAGLGVVVSGVIGGLVGHSLSRPDGRLADSPGEMWTAGLVLSALIPPAVFYFLRILRGA